MRIPSVLLSACMPATALAAGQGSAGGFSFISGFFQMLASLAVVIGAVVVTQKLIKRLMGGGLMNRAAQSYIRIVENRFIAPKKSLMLVEVGGEYLLLSSTDNGLNLIKQIDMIETIEVVDDRGAGVPERDVFRSVAGFVRKSLRNGFPARKGMD